MHVSDYVLGRLRDWGSTGCIGTRVAVPMVPSGLSTVPPVIRSFKDR